MGTIELDWQDPGTGVAVLDELVERGLDNERFRQLHHAIAYLNTVRGHRSYLLPPRRPDRFRPNDTNVQTARRLACCLEQLRAGASWPDAMSTACAAFPRPVDLMVNGLKRAPPPEPAALPAPAPVPTPATAHIALASRRHPLREVAWEEMLRLEKAELGWRDESRERRDRFHLHDSEVARRLADRVGTKGGFVRADKGTLLFRYASASLQSAVPADLRSLASPSQNGLRFPWGGLSDLAIKRLFDLVLEIAGTPGPPAPRAGGKQVVAFAPTKAARCDALEVLAEEDAARRPGRRGQGFGLTSAERRAVEEWAMAVAAARLQDEGWSVKDVSKTECYDFRCFKRAAELHVEVKGTTGAGEAVILTRNEVEHAREHYPRVALAVVSEIQLKRREAPEASGGKLLLTVPWQIDESDLDPVAYYYRASPRAVRRRLTCPRRREQPC